MSTLVAQTAPIISTQPANRTVTVGATANFTVVATGNPAPTYQWRKNNIAIAGATASTYVTPATIQTDNGSLFSVAVTNSVTTVVSSNATLTVNPQATVNVTGPGGVAAGQPAPFVAAASLGTPPLMYQWYKTAIAPANLIPGATSATYTIPVTNRATDDDTKYFVRITDASGIITDSSEVSLTVFQADQIITFNAPTNTVVAPTPIALVATASSGLPVTLALVSSPNATLTGNNLTLTGIGSVTVRATQAGNINYNAAIPVERTFAVGKGTPVITWTTPNAVLDGTSLSAIQLNATANVPGAFAYSPPSGTIVRTPSATLNVTFTPTDTTNYNIATASRILTVGALSSQTITFNAPTNPVVSPTAIALAATSTSGLPVTFTLLSGPATLNGSNLTLTGLGNVTVRASQAGNASFNPAVPVERTFTVNKGTPVITWTVVGAVPDGTVLGAAQLNATANVAGTFAYTPASGATLRAPSVTLNVTFTPTDTVNYNPATAQRTLAVTAASDPARLTNVSVRTALPAGQTLIVGFTMQGGAKPVLLRAVGPGLNQFGVGGTMTDPRMELFRGTTSVEANNNWGGSAALSAAFTSVGAFALPPTSLDAALLRSIEGGHTVQINGPAGIVLVEAYDAGSGASPRLSNVSARNRAGTGGDILIAGFTIGGTGQANLLIRGVGPTLVALGVTGAMVDPKVEVYSGATKISENDSWPATLTSTFATVGAFPLTAGSRDAALTLALSPGSYTVQVLGADGGTGEALVEIYELP